LQISTKSTAQFLSNSCFKNGTQKQKFPIWKIPIQNDRVYATLGSQERQVSAERLLHTRSTFSKSVIVSGTASIHGTTELMFIEPGVKINGAYYRDVLLGKHLLPAICSAAGDFFTDNAPAHRAGDTMEVLSRNTPDFISPFSTLPIWEKSPCNSIVTKLCLLVPFLTQSTVPDFIFIAPIVFLGANAQNWLFPPIRKVTLQLLELYQAQLWKKCKPMPKLHNYKKNTSKGNISQNETTLLQECLPGFALSFTKVMTCLLTGGLSKTSTSSS